MTDDDPKALYDNFLRALDSGDTGQAAEEGMVFLDVLYALEDLEAAR